jgi:hypothetical protein
MPTTTENTRHGDRREECRNCPLTEGGYCNEHGAEKERHMTTRSVGLWGLGIIVALMFSLLNVGIPIYQGISRIETKLEAVAAKQQAADERLERNANRLSEHIDASAK